MKTIFRYTNTAALMAAFIVLTAVAGFAQDPCADAEGKAVLDAKFRDNYAGDTAARAAAKAAKKDYDVALDLEQRKMARDAGKLFVEKFGACTDVQEFATYLKDYLPKMDKRIKDDEDFIRFRKILAKFNDGLKTKNWDDVYDAGKQILAEKPDDYRAVELVLGSVGYDEMFNGNNKLSDDTLKYAKQSLADLQAGKEFKPGFGVNPFSYKTKDDAIAWMNLTIGSIYQIAKKDKAAALPYLYAVTQASGSDVTKNPNPYDFIGSYYFDQVNKLVEQIKTKVADQKESDTPEVAKAKVDEIKGLVAMLNGTAERAMDAYSRAYTLGVKADYKAKMKKNIQDAYKVRFAKEEGLDAWIAAAMKKPFMDPTTRIEPISDPEPAATGSTTTTTTPAPPVKPAPAATKPPVTAPVKPATTAKPAAATKPQAKVKRPAAKKKGV